MSVSLKQKIQERIGKLREDIESGKSMSFDQAVREAKAQGLQEALRLLGDVERQIRGKTRRPMQEAGVYDPLEQAGHGDMISVDFVLAVLFGEKTSQEPPILKDLADMPNPSEKVTNGLHSVSEGKIFWKDNNKVTCREHGACNAVNKDCTIWRCLTCHEGAYVIWGKQK